MNFRSKDLLILLICGLVPIAVGGVLGWSVWLWLLLSVTIASGAALLLMVWSSFGGPPAFGAAPVQEAVQEEEPPTEPAYQETRLQSVPLPSAATDYDFLFSATVCWRPMPDLLTPSSTNLAGLASAAVLDRARAITSQEYPRSSDFTRYLLEGALGVAAQDGSALVIAMATNVTLTLAPADQERLRELASLRKAEEAWEHQRQYERNRRAYLGDEVLSSTGSAVVWWLARHDDEIEKAVEMIGPLAQISAAANDSEVPKLFQHLVSQPVGPEAADPLGGLGHPESDGEPWYAHAPAPGTAPGTPGTDDHLVSHLSGLLDELGLADGSDEQAVLVHRMIRTMEAAGRTEEAERVRQHFTAHRPDGSDHAAPTDDHAGTPPPSSAKDSAGPVNAGSPSAAREPGHAADEPAGDGAEPHHPDPPAADGQDPATPHRGAGHDWGGEP